MSYRIGEYNKNLFFAGNGATSGNFPGFKMNNQYRVYINYFDVNNVQLNQAGGQVEMSLHAAPMIKALAPAVQSIKSSLYFMFLHNTDCFYIYRMSIRVRFWMHRPSPVAA
jgi:hypothetical protein